jgi:N-acetylmuramoyl-L-alanine amidase
VRPIREIVVHCSATPAGLDIGAREIDGMHRQRGFVKIGYHYVIRLDGDVEIGRDLTEIGAHVVGHNAFSVGICLVGGLDHARQPANTFTPQQFDVLAELLAKLKATFPEGRILGHRDLSPDRDRDGVVERHEWVKDCPCFDVREWLAGRGLAHLLQTMN